MAEIQVRDRGSNPEPFENEIAAAAGPVDDTRPANPLDSDEALTELRQCEDWWCEARDLHAQNRVQMQLDHDYYDNLQWSEEEKAILLARGQAPLVYNKIAQTIDWITGTERRTRVDFAVHPRNGDGIEDANNKEKLLKYLSDVNRIGWSRSRAFKDGAIGGEGWCEQTVRGDTTQEMILDGYVPWQEVWRDPFDKSLDLDGSRYLHRKRWLDLDYAISLFPDREGILRMAARTHLTADDDWFDESLDLPQCFRRYDSNGAEVVQRRWMGQFPIGGGTHRLRVPITETWFKQPRRMKKIWGIMWPGEEFNPADAAQQSATKGGYATLTDAVTQDMKVCMWVPGGVLYRGKSPFKHGGFPFTPIFAKRRSRDGMAYGVVRGVRDAQDDLNKRKSKTQWLLSSAQFFYEDGAIDEERLPEIRLNLAKPNGEIPLADGGLQRIKVERNLELAEAQQREADYDATHIHDGTGVNREQLGRDTNASSGRAIRAKQDEGGVTTAELFDNLRLFVQLSGEKDLSLIEQYMTLPMQIRIEGDGAKKNPEFLGINQPKMDPGGNWSIENDVTKMAADFVVDEVDFRESIRQSQAEQLFDMLKTMPPEIQIQFLDLALDMTDIQNKQEWAKRARAISGQPDPESQDDPEAQAQQAAAAQQKQQQQAAAADQQSRAAEAKIAKDNASAQDLQARAGVNTAKQSHTVALAKNVNLNSKVRSMDIAHMVNEALPLAPSADRVYDGTRTPRGNNVAENAARQDSENLTANEIELTDAEKAVLAEAAEAGKPKVEETAAPVVEDDAAAKAAADADAKAKADAEAAAAAAAAAPPVVEAAAPPAPNASVFAPNLAPDTTRDFAAEDTALKQELRELNAKSRAGEIDDDTYDPLREALDEKRSALDRAWAAAETRAQLAAAVDAQSWTANRDAFLRLPENAIVARSPEHAAMWATMMKLAVTEAAAESKTLSDWDILTAGRDKLFKTLGLTAAPPVAEVKAEPTPPPNRAPPLDKLPPAVGGAPAATSGGKTTAEDLANNDILDIESYMASQTDDQRTALLKSVPGAFAD